MLTKNQIKLIKSLFYKKNRQRHGLFVVEGEKIVDEVINSDWEIDCIYATHDWAGQNAISISSSELSKISFLKSPNKVLALVKIKSFNNVFNSSTIIALDQISDPGNFGTIIRSADWFGITNILCSRDCVDLFNPKVIQSSMGSFLRTNLHYVNLNKELKKHKDYELFFTTLEGESIDVLKRSSNKIIVFGGEANGIRDEILKNKGRKITINRFEKSKAESLNVAIANAIILSRL